MAVAAQERTYSRTFENGLTAHYLDTDGTIYLHRDDGPAVYDDRGNETWFRRSQHHREHGPARTTATKREWFSRDQLHREDGPAVEHADGSQEWYRHGTLHRDDGPARAGLLMAEWFTDGRRHRDDGPAITYIDGDCQWWLHGRRYRSRAGWALARLLSRILRPGERRNP